MTGSSKFPLFLQASLRKPYKHFPPPAHIARAPPILLSLFDHPSDTWWVVEITGQVDIPTVVVFEGNIPYQKWLRTLSRVCERKLKG
jgi:hypothetical protein